MNPSFGGGSHASQGWWMHVVPRLHIQESMQKNVLPEVPHLASRDISKQQVGHCYQQHLHRHRPVALQQGGGLAPRIVKVKAKQHGMAWKSSQVSTERLVPSCTRLGAVFNPSKNLGGLMWFATSTSTVLVSWILRVLKIDY